MVLAKAQIGPKDIIIDIGAGTGSLSVEAALQATGGQVFAIEREQEGIDLIAANAVQFGVGNLSVIHGSAPAALSGLPPVDVILVGGSGGYLTEIIQYADPLLKTGGRMVITAVTVETLHKALTIVDSMPEYQCEASGLQVTRVRRVAAHHMFQALNPVYIISCSKGAQHDR